ncbi:response regulator [Nonlabens sp.]|uniref:response regulator n=1 Tax=Nonlabens sp. TaxID=1888209 RepID=UPI003F69F77C
MRFISSKDSLMLPPQIWIIDDNPIDCYVLKTMLEINELSNDVFIFSNNEEAIDQLNTLKGLDSNSSIHIITENKTKAVDGWSLVSQMSKLNKSLKFHMSSEQYDAQDIKRFQNTKAVLSLHVKPLRLDDLKQIIEF